MSKIIYIILLAIASFLFSKFDLGNLFSDKAEAKNATTEITNEAANDAANEDMAQPRTKDGSEVPYVDEGETQLRLEDLAKGDFTDGLALRHKGYASCFSKKYNTPIWVGWELTREEAYGTLSRKGYQFMPDPDVPYADRVTSHDYSGSGYDRGHMCPAGDMAWDHDAMSDCFYMTNICPQVRVVNQKYWNYLEQSCRRWAKKYGAIYIVCGPIYDSPKPRRIGREHMVMVPDAFYKVIVCVEPGKERGIGFYYMNAEDHQTMSTAACTIDDIEAATGIDFFSELDDELENKIEKECNLHSWH